MVSTQAKQQLQATLQTMTDCLSHRGPDGEGLWVNEAHGVALGHRRLAILDLSPRGAQPMTSYDGRYVMVYNGETYSAPELRAELEAQGARFRGSSDTEVMLEAISCWGLEHAVQRFIGMFAFAFFDHQTQILTLVRDRLGVKPLYWTQDATGFAFASELRSLMALPWIKREVNPDTLWRYLNLGFVPGEESIIGDIHRLKPAHILRIMPDGRREESCYWSLEEVAKQAVIYPDHRPLEDIEAEFSMLLEDAVKRRLLSDVPLGAFLSGGIDSSTVVALMRHHVPHQVRTFSIGFDDVAHNEAGHAEAVAKALGTDHTAFHVTVSDAQRLVPRLPEIADEPLADASLIPTTMVAELARKHVTVALSGDGGDELLGGYARHAFAQNLWPKIQGLPLGVRKGLGHLLQVLPAPALERGLSHLKGQPVQLQGRLLKLAAALQARGLKDAYLATLHPFQRQGFEWPLTLQTELSPLAQMQAWDAALYLPDNVLTKVDRATMSVGLEGREPLLDHRLLEFCWRLPDTRRRSGGVGKVLLRRVLQKYVPLDLIDRPKTGFSVPLESWLRGGLADLAGDVLAADAPELDPYWSRSQRRQLWGDFLSQKNTHSQGLWVLIMYLLWRQRWLI